MRAHGIITSAWIVCFLLAMLILEGYFFRTDSSGLPLLLPKDRVMVYKMLGLIYGANISSILSFWYAKPFPLPKRPTFTRFITALAIVLTLAYNLIILYLIGQGHFTQTESIDVILDRAKTIGGLLAFLTVPINAYYFGAGSKR